MSLPEFLQSFGTEAACAQAVMAAGRPNGFSCPKCGEEAHCVISVLEYPAGDHDMGLLLVGSFDIDSSREP